MWGEKTEKRLKLRAQRSERALCGSLYCVCSLWDWVILKAEYR